MSEERSSESRYSWTGFVRHLETAFRFPEGRVGVLVRPRFPRKLAGVCSGLALHFGWNVTLLRLFVIVLTLASSGCMAVAYAAAWVLIPEAPYSLPERTSGQPGTSPS